MRSSRWSWVVLLSCVPLLGACSSANRPSPQGIQLRPVLSESQATAASCPEPVQASASASNVRACSADGTVLYTLGAAAVTGDQVADLTVQPGASNGYEVTVRFSDSGSSAFRSLTGELASQDSPNNQFAFYARGVVQSSPYVSAAIDSGTAVVTGFANESEASQFVTDAAK